MDFFQTQGGQQFIHQLIAAQREQSEALIQISKTLAEVSKELTATREQLNALMQPQEKQISVEKETEENKVKRAFNEFTNICLGGKTLNNIYYADILGKEYTYDFGDNKYFAALLDCYDGDKIKNIATKDPKPSIIFLNKNNIFEHSVYGQELEGKKEDYLDEQKESLNEKFINKVNEIKEELEKWENKKQLKPHKGFVVEEYFTRDKEVKQAQSSHIVPSLADAHKELDWMLKVDNAFLWTQTDLYNGFYKIKEVSEEKNILIETMSNEEAILKLKEMRGEVAEREEETEEEIER